MPDYNKKEWAALCRTTTAIVTTNIHRGKIILLSDGKIDSENAINKAFFNKYSKKAEEELKQKNKTKEVQENINDIYNQVVEKATVKIKSISKEKEKKDGRRKSAEVVDWDTRKKIADALLQERKAEKEQLALEKMAGKLIPTALVFNILRVHNQSIFATFHNDVEVQASVFCDVMAGGDRKMLAKVTEKLSEKLSDSVKRAEEVALASVENAIEEYTETRSRGERK